MHASFLDDLLDWLMPLFSNWGYLIVLVGVFLESMFLTGWIAPGTTVILIAGFYAAHGEMNIYAVWAISAGAALLGDNIGYLVGRRAGRGVTERYGDRPRTMERLERSQRFFDRYGGVTVLFGRMVSGLDAFIPLTAGLNAMPYWKYMLFDIPGAMLWSGVFCALGYLFGNNWRSIDRFIDYFGWGTLGVLAMAAFAAFLVRRRRKVRRAAASEGDAEGRSG